MSRKKVMQNEKRVKKTAFNNVCLNTFWLCKPSKLIRRWRYVNTNIKVFHPCLTKSPIVLAFLISTGMLFG